MKTIFANYIEQYFNPLIEKYNFSRRNELNDGQTYSVEYASTTFVIQLEKYRREFYVTLYKANQSNDKINLFNLLDYLSKPSLIAPAAEYFRDESNIEECYRKQLNHIATVIYDNLTELNNFFSSEDYDSKVAGLESFVLNKYPELFKRS